MCDHSSQNPIFWVLQNTIFYLCGCARQITGSLSRHLLLYLFNPRSQSVTRFYWFFFLSSSWIILWPPSYHLSLNHHSRSLHWTVAITPGLVSSKAITTLKLQWSEGSVHNVNMSSPAWRHSRARLKEACRPCLCEGFRSPSHVCLSFLQPPEYTMFPSTTESLHMLFLLSVPSLICLINSYSPFIFHLISLREAFSDFPVKSPII